MEFALLAWRDDGRWRTSLLSEDSTKDIGLVLDALRAQQVDGGAVAMLAIDDQFFIIIRQIGSRMQMVLSDVMAALDYEIAAEVLELSDIEFPAEDDADEPAGDLNIFNDLGLDALELQFICDDDEMFPDEQLEVIARRVGFGDQFMEVIDKL